MKDEEKPLRIVTTVFSAVLALLWVVYHCLVNDMPWDVAVPTTFSFLFWWHVVFACVFVLCVGVVFSIGLLAMVADSKEETRVSGAVTSFVAAPIMAIMGTIEFTLFIGGILCMDMATVGAAGERLSYADWNMQTMVIGIVLYCVGCCRQAFVHSIKKSITSD